MTTPVGLSDILTATKNVVSALANLRDIYAKITGNQASPEIAAAALVFSGQGRAVRVSVTTLGATDGLLYDSSSPTALSNPIAVVPMAVGITEIGIEVKRGLVFVPGTSQKAVVVFSQ